MRTRYSWAQLWPKPHASAATAHDQSGAVLNQLRELRATLAGHTARFDRVEQHVGRIDEQLRDIQLLLARTLAQDAAHRLKPGNTSEEPSEEPAACQGGVGAPPEDRRAASPEDRREEDRLEDRVSDIERRLARVEERLGG